MATNFEAANMAGYNNPKIEVFSAVTNPDDNTIISAPSKTEIIRCLRRGSIPAILQTIPDGSESNLYWIMTWATSAEGDSIIFGIPTFMIYYIPDSDTPIVTTGP